MSYHDEDDEKIMSGYDLPPIARGHLFLSPDQEQQREADGNTPTRVLSCHSLAGEDFILSARPSLDFPGDIAISPFTPSEGTQTPPMGLPDLMTPPPLHPLPTLPSPTSPLNIVAGSKPHPGSLATTSSSLPGRMRPPRVPHVSLQPTRVINARHGRGLSYSDYSFLSALTDGTNDMTPSVSSNLSIPRRRTVSWDYNDAEDRGNQTTDNSVRSTPAALLQPVLKEEFGAPLASIVTNTGQKVSSFSLSRQPRTQRTKDDNGISSSSIGMRSTKRHPTIHAADAKTESSRRGAVWNPSTAQDTGSFIHILDQSLDPQTPPSTRRAVSPGAQQRHGSSEGPFKKYSIADVLDSYPPEPPEETLFIGRIESQKISWNHNSLTTDLPAETLIQYISNSNNEIPHDVKHPESSAASPQIRRSADSSFEGITKKLLDASPNQRKYSSGTAIVPEHRRQPTDLPKNAGEKMHEATEVLFGGYSDSIFDAGNDEEMPTPRHPQSANQEANDVASTTWAPWHPFMAFRKKTRADLAYFAEFLGPQRPSLQKEFLRLARLIMLPSLGIATILFYLFPNPPTGYNHPENENVDAETIIGPKGNENPASYSWLILFYGVRQMITLELARFSQLIIIDFFTIRTKIFPKALGPTLALMVVQAKGWPFILTFWALWDFALLYGYNRFANHWMYWQTWINMFNETNPHGNTTSGDMYGRVLILACVLGITISVKRAVVGQIVGKRVVRELFMKKLSSVLSFKINGFIATFQATIVETWRG